MKRQFDWQDLKLFLSVALSSGLAGSVRDSRVSAATLSRRITALEKDLGERLFVRGTRGYELTAAGIRLKIEVIRMEAAAADISKWINGLPAQHRVRISGGGWTMQLLIDNLKSYWTEDDIWVPEFLSNYSKLDIARREIDIGIRNRRPTEAWLAVQKIGVVQYAAYRARGVNPKKQLGWIGIAEDTAFAPTARWTNEQHGSTIVFTISHPPLGLSLVRQGLAQMAMPCFVGDAFEDLERATELIPELKSEQWLVMHQDDRNHPPIRKAIQSISQFLTKGRQLVRS
jgi:DNA-binding transcriptional LysR family regulator